MKNYIKRRCVKCGGLWIVQIYNPLRNVLECRCEACRYKWDEEPRDAAAAKGRKQ